MPMHCFMKMDGVTGESTEHGHKGSIDVLSWNWGASNAPLATGGGATTGKPVPAPLVFQHRYDKASPTLGKFCASGKRVQQARLTVRAAGVGRNDFLVVTLKDVLVTSVQVAMPADGHPEETVSLAYAEVECAYRPQTPSGGLGTTVRFDWDTRTNTVR